MKRVLKWTGIVIGGIIALLVIVAVVLMLWKPWAPSFSVAEPGEGGVRVTDDGYSTFVVSYYGAEGQPRP